MTHAQTNNYWINRQALNISLNARGNPDYIAGSTASGAVIMVYMKDIGEDDFFGYDAGHNHRRWPLTLSPTAFGSTSRKYVYAAIPKSAANGASAGSAMIVFPSEEIDLYGYAHDITKDEEGNDIDTPRLVGSEDYYYIYLRGIISATDGTTPREWEQKIEYGMLSTDEGIATSTSDAYEYDPLSDTIRFIKRISDATFLQLTAAKATITNLVLGGAEFLGKAVFGQTPADNDNTIATPKYVTEFGNAHFLRKDADDETAHTLTVKNLVARNTVGSDTFTAGAPLAGSGWQVNQHGDIEAESIKVRGFMEVPEIRFNRASIIAGTNIQSPCAGIIKSVQPLDDSHGIAWLELGDDDIAGSIQEGDLCWGYWHDITTKSNNAKEDYDNHAGIIDYSGFATVYFNITKVLTPQDGDYPNNSSAFLYELKPDTKLHPYPQMHFGGRGNNRLNDDGTPRYPERQGFTIATPNYLAVYQLVGGWDWNSVKHIVYVRGLLDGFEARANKQPGTWRHKYGVITGDIYFTGGQEKVQNTGRYLYITQSSNGIIDEGETETVRIEVRDNSFANVTKDVTVKVNDTKVDAQTDANGDAAIILKYAYDALSDEVTRFSVTAEYTLYDNGTPVQRTIEEVFTIRKMPPRALTLYTNLEGDPFIDKIAPRRVICGVRDNYGLEITSKVTQWQIERESTDPLEDATWLTRDKVRTFNGTIDLYWSDDVTINDLDPNAPTTRFHITATIGSETLSHDLVV